MLCGVNPVPESHSEADSWQRRSVQAEAQKVSVGLDENAWEEVLRIKDEIGRDKKDILSYSRQS